MPALACHVAATPHRFSDLLLDRGCVPQEDHKDTHDIKLQKSRAIIQNCLQGVDLDDRVHGSHIDDIKLFVDGQRTATSFTKKRRRIRKRANILRECDAPRSQREDKTYQMCGLTDTLCTIAFDIRNYEDNSPYSPKCSWLDANHGNDIASAALKFRTRAYGEEAKDLAAMPPRMGPMRALCKPSGKRSLSMRPGWMQAQLVMSNIMGQSAQDLCNCETSYGPDFTDDEGNFCDMETKAPDSGLQ
ncbi:hypothetical protein AC578_7835 [Pseudocercospora eumusae]|uniref:Uncharacterized protein n=1 Tax=Pseudocercospora eumusae TaxID=321146 RepID=A0A139HIT8_9PEZI|nr:hypothetical protein AC578_7835 [Pseudocercospora eumusae]